MGLLSESAQTFDRVEQLERLYSLYADDVLRVCYFYLGDRQRAEDVCQDVFVRLLTKGPMAMRKPGCSR